MAAGTALAPSGGLGGLAAWLGRPGGLLGFRGKQLGFPEPGVNPEVDLALDRPPPGILRDRSRFGQGLGLGLGR